MAIRKTHPKKRYRSKWELEYREPGGRRRFEYFELKSSAEARDLEIRQKKTEGRLVNSSAETFKSVAERYLTQRQRGKVRGKRILKPSSKREHDRVLKNHLLPKFGFDRVQCITRERIEDLEHKLALAGAAPQTRLNILSVLTTVLDFAVAERLVEVNRATRIHLTVPDGGEMDWEARAESEATQAEEAEEYFAPLDEKTAALYVKTVLASYPTTSPVRPFLIEALRTGKRRGELHGGKWRDYRIENTSEPCVHIRRALDPIAGLIPPKSKSALRTIPLFPDTVRALLEWKLVCPDRSEDAHVYTMGMGTAYRQHHAILKKIGVPKFKLHDLRDCFASLMAERGVSPATLKYLMGHKDERTTARFYKRPTRDGVERAREAMSLIAAES